MERQRRGALREDANRPVGSVSVLGRIRTWHVFIAAFTVRLAYLLVRDSSWILSENLRAGFTLAEKGYLGDPFAVATGPTAHVAPAYPVIIAAVRLVAPTEDATVAALSVVMAFICSLNVAALIPIGRALRLPDGAGGFATLLWILPLFGWIELSAQHETPLTVTAILGTLLVLGRTVQIDHPGIAHAALLGLVTGAASYIAPTVLPIAVLTAATALIMQRVSLEKTAIIGATAVFVFLLVIAPYTVRNHRELGAWFFMRDNFGLELAMSNAENAHATQEENLRAGGPQDQHPFNSGAAALSMRRMGEYAYYQSQQRSSIEWIKANPGKFATLVAKRAGYLLLPDSIRWYQRWLAAGVSALFFIGSVALWNSRYRLPIRCLTSAAAGFAAVFLLVEYDIRYVYPLLWIESLTAGAFLAFLVNMRKRGAVTDFS